MAHDRSVGTGAREMGQIARILGAARHPVQAGACGGERDPERPVSFAEIAAASAFLDFGGVPDGHRPRAGGSPEAAISDRRMPLGTEPSIFNFAMCFAAFGIVALVVVFAHPASRTSGVAAANAAAGSEVAAADRSLKPAPTPRQHAKRQGSQP
jgi:hypothetical protein